MAAVQLWTSNEEFVRVWDLYDPLLKTRFIIARITATIRDHRGAEVPGVAWPLVLNRVPGIKGAYRGTKAGGLALDRSTAYTIAVTAEAGSQVARWNFQRTPQLQAVSHSTVLLTAPPLVEAAEVFGSAVLGLNLMTASAYTEPAELFGAATITHP